MRCPWADLEKCGAPDSGAVVECSLAVVLLGRSSEQMRALMSEAGSGPVESGACSYLIEPSPGADGALLRALRSPIITAPLPQMEMSVSLTGPGSSCLRPRPLYLSRPLPKLTMCSVTAD
ncbi:hypothetical protein WMY93_017539 [Mugilogobius chulae]|uniref:Uncharacterized protein n=1 Tax=Mugilogobius chulae TaxID=88201 RepID=A0AAW0NYU4_9GOBI